MIRILLAGFQTAGAIRYSFYSVIAGLFAIILAIGAVRVAVGDDWIDAVVLVLLTAMLFLSARRQYKTAKAAVVAVGMKARGLG